MISYSQNFEDVMLERVFHGQRDGFYIDVGAWDPDRDSVTKYFYENGWSGINIEPSKNYFELLDRRRPRDINLNMAVGDKEGFMDFYEVPGTGLSSLISDVKEQADRRGFKAKKCRVPVITLNSICEKYCEGMEIKFLKIDVEGFENDVVRSLDWQKFRPIVVLIEAVHPESRKPTWGAWEPFLLNVGYTFVWFDGLNRFYIRNENIHIRRNFMVPPGVLDGFLLPKTSSFCEKAKYLLISRAVLKKVIPKPLLNIVRKLISIKILS